MIKHYFTSLTILFLLLFSVSVLAMEEIKEEGQGLRKRKPDSSSKTQPQEQVVDIRPLSILKKEQAAKLHKSVKVEVSLTDKIAQGDDYSSYLADDIVSHILSALNSYDLLILGETSKRFNKLAEHFYINHRFEIYDHEDRQFKPYQCVKVRSAIGDLKWLDKEIDNLCKQSHQLLLALGFYEKKPYLKFPQKEPIEVSAEDAPLLSSFAPEFQQTSCEERENTSPSPENIVLPPKIMIEDIPLEKQSQISQLARKMGYLQKKPQHILVPENYDPQILGEKIHLALYFDDLNRLSERSCNYCFIGGVTTSVLSMGIGLCFPMPNIIFRCGACCFATSLCVSGGTLVYAYNQAMGRVEEQMTYRPLIEDKAKRIFTSLKQKDLFYWSDKKYLLSGKLIKKIIEKNESLLRLGSNDFVIRLLQNTQNTYRSIHDRAIFSAKPYKSDGKEGYMIKNVVCFDCS